MAGTIDHDPRVRSEEPVRPDTATLAQPTGHEIRRIQADGVSIFPCLAGDLAEDQVVTLQRRQDQRGSPLRLAQV